MRKIFVIADFHVFTNLSIVTTSVYLFRSVYRGRGDVGLLDIQEENQWNLRNWLSALNCIECALVVYFKFI